MAGELKSRQFGNLRISFTMALVKSQYARSKRERHVGAPSAPSTRERSSAPALSCEAMRLFLFKYKLCNPLASLPRPDISPFKKAPGTLADSSFNACSDLQALTARPNPSHADASVSSSSFSSALAKLLERSKTSMPHCGERRKAPRADKAEADSYRTTALQLCPLASMRQATASHLGV